MPDYSKVVIIMGNTLRRIRELGFATALALAAMLAFGTVVAAPASALDTPTISGVVYGHSVEGTTVLPGIQVMARQEGMGEWQSIRTDAEGRYSLTASVGARYYIMFQPSSESTAAVRYPTSSATVAVEADSVTFDMTIEQTSTITGTTSQMIDGILSPAAGVMVNSFTGNYFGPSATSDADGRFTVDLPQGTYKLGFDVGYGGDGKFLPEYYADASNLASAQTIEVGFGATLAGIDATLVAGGMISGTVTKDVAGLVAPVEYAQVTAYSANDGTALAWARSDADGNYAMDQLVAGTYKLHFGKSDDNLLPEYYADAADLDSAQSIEVSAGSSLSGIDATLDQGSTIAGTVTKRIDGATSSAEDVSVRVLSASTGNYIANGGTDIDGHYSIDGLTAGSYVLYFSTYGGGLMPEYYDNAATRATAKPVVVAAQKTVSGVNAVLEPGGTITGTVSSAQGPLDGYVTAYSLQGGDWSPAGNAFADDFGNYSLTDLAAGSYKVGFAHYASGSSLYQPEFYDDASDLDSATSLMVETARTVSGINAVLSAAGTVATVTPGAPTISGTAKVGSVLTANPGTWTPSSVTFRYQWYRSGAAVTGATAKTLTLTATDLGKTMTVKVTGSQSGYLSAAATSAATAAIAAAPTTTLTAPVPTITGTLKGGNVLNANAGTWGPATVTLAYQWYRSGVLITGATAKTLTLAAADVGQTMKVKVTGSKAGYTTAAKTSAATAAITTGTLTSAIPTITGTKKVGSALTAAAGTWGPGTVTLKYQWYRTGVAITGATAKTYTLAAADLAKKMTVKVTGSKSGATTVAKTSVATTAVVAGTLTAPTPTITGTKKSGYTLTANPGTWGPATVTLKYQWYRSGVAISGATLKTYKLVSADRADTIKVRVVGSKSGYTSVAKYSASTVKIP